MSASFDTTVQESRHANQFVVVGDDDLDYCPLIVHLVLHASIIFVLIDSCPYADCCLHIRDSRVLECSRPQYSSWATLGLLPYLPVISGDMGRSSCQFPLAIWAFLTKSCQPRSKLASWDLYVEAMVRESCPKSLVVIVKIHSLPLD